MAGPFTHILVADAAWQQVGFDRELAALLSRHRNLLFLGSVAPDIPAIHEVLHGIAPRGWENVLHTSETAALPTGALAAGLRAGVGEREDATLAWVMGYVAHVVTDATVHPIVDCILTEHGESMERDPDAAMVVHRRAEMTQDSLLVEERTGLDITRAELSSRLVEARREPHYDAVLDYWQARMDHEFPAQVYGRAHVRRWVDTFIDLLDVAEPGRDRLSRAVVFLSRHIDAVDRLVYESAAELRARHAHDVRVLYEDVPLPGGRRGAFRQEGFERSVANVLRTWEDLGACGRNRTDLSEHLLDWDLNTGRAPGGALTFWT